MTETGNRPSKSGTSSTIVHIQPLRMFYGISKDFFRW